jgi:hypothetical protein
MEKEGDKMIDVKQLDIKNVKQENDIISFDIGKFGYYLRVVQFSNGIWMPCEVQHKLSNPSGVACPICGNKLPAYCVDLWQSKNELFLKLISFNSTRLIWIFRNYEGRE